MHAPDRTAAARVQDWANPRPFVARFLANAVLMYTIATILDVLRGSPRAWQDSLVLPVIFGLVAAGPRPRWVKRAEARLAGSED